VCSSLPVFTTDALWVTLGAFTTRQHRLRSLSCHKDDQNDASANLAQWHRHTHLASLLTLNKPVPKIAHAKANQRHGDGNATPTSDAVAVKMNSVIGLLQHRPRRWRNSRSCFAQYKYAPPAPEGSMHNKARMSESGTE
jgi:hypothetical protein